MTYGREKRLLLGIAALVVALPLPLNEMLEWPVLAAFVGVVAVFLRRALSAGSSERWLSNRTLNILGLLYLPILVLDVGTLGRVQLLRPVLHLTLFVVAVKLWSLREEKHKWQVWIGIFFLFLASMATSVHPSIVLYLAFFLALTVVVMLRFVYLHALTAFGHRDGEAPRLPTRGFAVATVIATLVLAVPLFALLPRMRSPYILGPGGSGQGELARAGFSDEMSLDLIGRIRNNEQVAMRLTFSGRTSPPGAMRFKAATYEIWEGRSWIRSARARTLFRDPREGLFRLASGRAEGSVRIFLEPLRSTSLVVPMEALTVDTPLASIEVDRGGALFLRGMPDEILEYGLTLGPREQSIATPPAEAVPEPAPERAPEPAPEFAPELAPELDRSGVTPRIAELAATWAGEGTALERARRIERRLMLEYGYTLEFIGRGGSQPIENFLFEARRGHCEYFASSMVLLLRAEAIPSRLVTGFLGAEYSSWERAWLVRQSNAHAWVEAFVPGEGWIAFDPTPPLGRPQIEPESFAMLLRQAYEYMTFRWDRYVISFDFYDQVGMLFNARALWERLKTELFAATSRGAYAVPPDAAAPQPGDLPGDPIARNRFLAWVVAAAILLALAGAFALWRQRSEWNRTRAYGALIATLRAGGVAVPEWSGPLAVGELAARRFPAAAPASARIVRGYMRESFGGEAPAPETVAAARRDLSEVEAAIRATVRSRVRDGSGTAAAMKYSGRSDKDGQSARRRRRA